MIVKMSFYTRATVYKEVEMTQEAYDGIQAQLENLRGREARRFEGEGIDAAGEGRGLWCARYCGDAGQE